MTDEPKEKAPEQVEESQPAKQKSPIIKYAIFGIAGLVVVVGIAFGVALVMGGGSAPAAESAEVTDSTAGESTEESHADAHAAANDHGGHDEAATVDHGEAAHHDAEHHESADPHNDIAQAAEDYEVAMEEMLAESEEPDETVFENIMDNLAFLDYQPEDEELTPESEEEARQRVEDSIAQANWLENEKSRLAEKEAELDKRERELQALEREVSQKLLKLEQAETTRINNLAKLYDGMDPRAVAQVMAGLDDETVVSILPRMKTKSASSVMALFPPRRAARLSKQMITIAEN